MIKQFVLSSALAAIGCLSSSAVAAEPGNGPAASGAVYTMDNSAAGNHLLVFSRASNGELKPFETVVTGGLGTGSGLGSQGAILLSRDGHWLFVCDGGSDEISVFAVSEQGVNWVSKVGAQGHKPISLTQHGNLVYVLDAGGNDVAKNTLTGFVFAAGQLIPLPGSTRGLSSPGTDVGPAQVSFTSDGQVLVVTEKSTSLIDTFAVGDDGLIQGSVQSFASNGPTPFGFATGRQNRLFVSNAADSSLSSYESSEDGNLQGISSDVQNGQLAACWVALTGDERFAYTANAHNNTLSGYAVSADGSLRLLPGATTTPAGPLDLALSRDSRFLYSLDSAGGTIAIFRIEPNGALDPVTSGVSGIAAASSGLAAR
jgi:6-phosphogluconolactonase